MSARVFTLFPELPPELRLQIWQQALEPQTIELELCEKLQGGSTRKCFVSHKGEAITDGERCCCHFPDSIPPEESRGLNKCECSALVKEGHLEEFGLEHIHARPCTSHPHCCSQTESRERWWKPVEHWSPSPPNASTELGDPGISQFLR
jgi:hypothetical protein